MLTTIIMMAAMGQTPPSAVASPARQRELLAAIHARTGTAKANPSTGTAGTAKAKATRARRLASYGAYNEAFARDQAESAARSQAEYRRQIPAALEAQRIAVEREGNLLRHQADLARTRALQSAVDSTPRYLGNGYYNVPIPIISPYGTSWAPNYLQVK